MGTLTIYPKRNQVMNTAELLDAIDNNGENAEDILRDSHPGLVKEFKAATRKLAKLMEKVRETYPDANYYVVDGQFNLMIGDSHPQDGIRPSDTRSCPELVAVNCNDLGAVTDGGGW